jgi:hypothetical protein
MPVERSNIESIISPRLQIHRDETYIINKPVSNISPMKEKNIISGSNFDYMRPEVGVIVNEEGKLKSGGIDYYRQFGKISKYDFEKLKELHMQGNYQAPRKISNSNNLEFNNYHNSINANFNMSHIPIIKNEIKQDFNSATLKNIVDNIPIIKEQAPFQVKADIGNIIWSSNDDYASTHHTEKEKAHTPLSNTHLPIVNENLFKNRRVSDIRNLSRDHVYGTDEINKFNLNIINNGNWGSENIKRKIQFNLNNETRMPIKPNKSNLKKEIGMNN